jgi:NADPH:quinone reductase-like Zn-dependent oxidoreductase
MRAVQITRFGGPEVLDVVDLPGPTPGEGQQLFDVSTAGVNYAGTHCGQSRGSSGAGPAPLAASSSRAVDGARVKRGCGVRRRLRP